MIEGIYLAADEASKANLIAPTVYEQRGSIGKMHQKMTDNYETVEVLPKKAKTKEEIFRYADGYGKIRFGYFYDRRKESSFAAQNGYAAAIGGILGVRSAKYRGFSLNAAAYISQDIPFLYDTDKRVNDFYTARGESYAYLAEASLEYTSTFFNAKLGRITVDVPYADTDDIRMSQNSFEGVLTTLHYNDRWSSRLLYLQRWAGFDSSDEKASQNEFKKLVEGGKGMFGASLSYEYAEDSEVSLWYHRIDKTADILYGEISGVYGVDESLHFDYALQAAHIMQKEASGVNGDVYGASIIGHYDTFFVGAAANFALVDEKNSLTDGFGGGPYFTSLDEETIASVSEEYPGEDIDMYRLSVGYDKKRWYSSFEYAYGYIDCKSDTIQEHDLLYSFDLDEKWEADAVGAYIKMEKSDTSYNRVVVRIDYNF